MLGFCDFIFRENREKQRLKCDMKILRKLRDYICYCGISKAEYYDLKREAYKSNYEVWRILHYVMTTFFTFLFVYSIFNELFSVNRPFYMIAFIYSAAATCTFFFLKKDSITAQFVIYLSIVMLLLFGCFISKTHPEFPATMFIVMLIVTPLFMIDRPFYMAIVISAMSVIFSIWMHSVKPYDVWQADLINTIIYSILGIFIHVIVNSIRIREFVLTKKINIQKDMDEMTGLKNKGALTREINEFLSDKAKDKGVLILLDIDHFKTINDTYGHDVGDSVISQLGEFLKNKFPENAIVGRFGGDEFIVFIKDIDDVEYATAVAKELIEETPKKVLLPVKDKLVGISLGITTYHGFEQYYSEIFKKADIALYKTKADRTTQFHIC